MPTGKLTPREIECLKLVSEGKTAVHVGEVLELSERTVEHYLETAARKLNAQTRTHAVVIALREGIIDDTP